MDCSYAYGLLGDDMEPAPVTFGLELEERRGGVADRLARVFEGAFQGGDADAGGADLREELRNRHRADVAGHAG